MPQERFATAINCIDGRVQEPVAAWLKTELGVDYVDMVTEPGPDAALSDADIAAAIRRKVAISVAAHGSEVVAVVGHHDCAGNPVSPDEHRRQIERGVALVASWGLPVRVLGLWLGERWQVDVVRDTTAGGGST